MLAGETVVQDLLFIAIGAGLFAAFGAYAHALGRL